MTIRFDVGNVVLTVFLSALAIMLVMEIAAFIRHLLVKCCKSITNKMHSMIKTLDRKYKTNNKTTIGFVDRAPNNENKRPY